MTTPVSTVFVLVVEYPSDALEYPEVTGVYGSETQAMEAALDRARELKKLYIDEFHDLEILERNQGYDLDDDNHLWCLRISEVPFPS